MATLHPTKSTTPVPERTEEDNQRLFQLYNGWTLTERDGQHADKGERRWVCCLCIKQKRPRPKSYAIKGLQNAEGHLYTDHNGIMDPTGKRQKPTKASEKAHQSIATILQLNPKEPKEQDLINTLIKRFDKTVFQQKLINWIVNSNQSFSIVNDQDLRDIFNYLNPSVEITKANITDVTVRAIAEREFTNNIERIKDALQKSPGQIHIQYDGWKSGNRHALYGITCVFRDSNNRPQKYILGLPELTERHTGENIAGQIIEIIREYEISNKLGYFTLDNAGNNKISMGELGLEFGFDWEKRWNPDAFEKEVFEGLHTAAKEHEVWRRRVSVGKWHNFAVEVSRSDTWTDMLKKVQAVESQLSDDAQLKKHCPVGVVVDNATRWLSQFSMIKRALVLRPFYNSFIQRASNEWEKVNLTRAGHIKKGSKLPFFLKEENRITPDDWHVLGTLYDILLDFQLVVRGLEGDGQGKHRRKVEENEIDPPLSGTSWDLIHAYEFLLETLESAKRAVANFPDGHHLAVNINLGWLKLNEYYEHLNNSPLIYGAAGDDDERQLWITKAKEMVQDLWGREYRDLEVDGPEIELPANKRLKTSRNKFTAWRTKKRGLTAGGISVTESPIQSPAQSPRSSVGGLDLDEYEQWQRDIDDADASVTDPYEYWHIRRLKYPRLSRMALDLLTVPPMSAECERLFSTTGRMVTKSRNRLDASLDSLVVGSADPKRKAFLKGPQTRNWTSFIKAITADGRALVPGIIFKGKELQKQWFLEEFKQIAD
ncbi:hAT family dimerization domain protein [Fusarium oxysporum f. sp. phaseoli]